jgi:protein-S-isoprenylcysteine O-methyltransferase Ste14
MIGINSAALSAVRARLDETALYDWIMRIPIVAYALFILTDDVIELYHKAATQQLAFHGLDSGIAVAAMARVSQWIFVLLLAVFQLFRLRPIRKSDQIWPRLLALTAVCLIPIFMLLERAPANIGFNSAAVVLALVANIMSVVTVSYLGRSLSIMPEARSLVTSGPYALVRHPLYLCEMIGVFAMVLQYRSLLAVGLLVVFVSVQILRGRVEEAVLVRAFPDFSSYQARTSFLVPRDPARFLAVFALDPSMRRRSAIVIGSTVMVSALALTVALMPG